MKASNIETRHQRFNTTASTMCSYRETNIAPTATSPSRSSSSSNNEDDGLQGVSYRLRHSSTALGLLNRGLAKLYQGNSEEYILWREEEEQELYERKLAVMMKNSHVFQKFKDRVAASETVANPFAARLVLEEFLHHDLVFVGKQGVIQRHSNLIQHLALTRRSAGSATTNKMPLRKASTEKEQSSHLSKNDNYPVVQYATKDDSVTVSESSSSSSSYADDFSVCASWSPETGEKTVSFSGITPCLQVPEFDGTTVDVSEGSFAN